MSEIAFAKILTIAAHALKHSFGIEIMYQGPG